MECRSVRQLWYVYYIKGEYDHAIRNYSKAIKINPGYTRVYINRGDAYFMKGEYEQAISDYTKALELNPRLAKAYDGRGIAQQASGL
jgi:tetratricopeptide (TPR) repeat protein